MTFDLASNDFFDVSDFIDNGFRVGTNKILQAQKFKT